jgi:D-alanyl-D-alanine endopeptidase (penicillin-binding protein 7)
MKILFALILCVVTGAVQARENSVVVYNISRDTIEHLHNADNVRPIASITKLMTAMVALDYNKDLQQLLTVKKGIGSHLPPGEYTRGQLILTMLINSDNGAADVIAEDYPGGKSAFVAEMNRHARAWALTNTKFIDPSGLSVFNVSTARELVNIIQISSNYWFIKQASGYRTVSIKITDRKKLSTVTLPHTSGELLSVFDHVVISKTGFTNPAGWCVSMLVEQHQQQYAVIVLGSNNKTERISIIKQVLKNL